MNPVVDLRSDTVTRPTPEMYDAMQRAAVGDDVLGDDPTVAELERLSAGMLGKEAAMFVVSGTMGNQIAAATHTRPGDAILLEEEAHMLYYEVGGTAMLAGCVNWSLRSDRGAMDPDDLRRHFHRRDLHTPGTTLLCVENTHNRAGGRVIPIDRLREYRSLADELGMKVHMDGARVFNASVASGVPIHEIAATADTVNFCLSKGLRAPVGSVLCGPKGFIEEARIWRKRLGGGIRQGGILAACGIVSLTQMVERLADDHVRAKRLAAGLQGVHGLHVDPADVETNLVLVGTDRPSVEWQSALAEKGVLFFPVGSHRFRLVTHADVSDAHVERALEAFSSVAR